MQQQWNATKHATAINNEQAEWRNALKSKSILTAVIVISMLICGSLAFADEVVYIEDFSSDPGYSLIYTPESGEFFTWDSAEGVYKVRVHDDHPLDLRYSVSPAFEVIENQSFELSFDLKVVTTSYGHSQGIRFCNPLPAPRVTLMCEFYGSHRPQFTIRDGSEGSYINTGNVSLNTWYSISIDYSLASGTADIRVTERSTGTVVYDYPDYPFSPVPFSGCALGASVVNGEGSWSEMHYDNIYLAKTDDQPNIDPIAYWNFDNCDAIDVTGNGHDGVMDDDPECIEAPCGNAWLPDGINDEIKIVGNLGDLMFSNESLTISAWVKVLDNPNFSRVYVYLGRDASHSGNSEIYLMKDRSGNNQGRLIMGVARHGAHMSKAFSTMTGETIPKDTWLHLVGVVDYENQDVRLYINGEPQINSGSLTSFDLASGSDPFRAHMGAYEHSDFQNGPIDEVRIYDRVLSEAEIQELYEECAPMIVQPVALDIKPGSCPNPLNINTHDSEFWVYEEDEFKVENSGESSDLFAKAGPWKKRGVLPVAILGTDDFDVNDIDVASVTLEGISSRKHSYKDVATPIADDAEECECNVLGPDGYTDLTLKFDKTAITLALGEISVGDVIPLEITGELFDGTPFTGTDCVVIVGNPHFTSVETDVSSFGLSNYPNPFNPTTEISFSIPVAGHVTLDVFNIMGQKVTTLLDRYMQPGTHEVTWNANNVSSGVYFYRLTAGDLTETKKMTLLK